MRAFLIPTMMLAVTVSGCNMAPHYVQPESGVPVQWPQGAAYEPLRDGEAGMPWRSLFTDPRLQGVIERALANNQDLQASLANVASARAQYHVERSYQLPTISANADASLTHGGNSTQFTNQSYSANVGFSAFELDLFGRLKNQSREALEKYLGTESGYRSARLTLVANVATAYVTLAADRDLLALAEETRDSGQRTVELTRSLFRSGLTNAGDLASAETTLQQANSDIASQTTQVAQDRNALELLVGGPVQDAELPASLAELDARIGNVPAGLSSQLLLRRPDVVEAEHNLKAIYAQIGAARAAFFPTISLTSAIGVASTALRSLFTGDAFNISGSGSANLPLLGGTNNGNLEYAEAQRRYYLATYRSTVQSAFKDVADALARRGTITSQRTAQDRLVAAGQKSYDVAYAQYRTGIDTFLNALVAQRALYGYRQSRVSTTLVDLTNRITIYSAIGSDESLSGQSAPQS